MTNQNQKTGSLNYNTFGVDTLGHPDNELISTWLDDRNKLHSNIMDQIMIKIGKDGLKPIHVCYHPKYDRYMAKEHYKIEGMDIIFMPSQPDGMWFKESDVKELTRVLGL